MAWLEIIRTLWPIVAFIAALVVAVMPLWLRTIFPTKADLALIEARLAEGSRKLADLDKRVAIVEQDCDSNPSKSDLNQGMSVLAGRMSGVESAVRGVEKQVGTTLDLLHTVIQHGLTGTNPK
ncbi:MAG: hypothetical protein QOI38_2063 [Sphingomonadales bacterium]|nr:hypothetical protein [Sphingomonadales bacterium]